MTDPAVQLRDVSYRYRDQQGLALKDISLDVAPGEFVAVLGPTGAGKSTLAALTNGLVPHYFKGTFQGDVTVLGTNTRTTGVAGFAALVGLVFQDFEAQLFSTSVELEVAFGPENLGVPRDEIARRVEKMLAMVGLSPLKGRHPSTLSGGQKQRLAIASVLALEPRVLVMDEPTTDLDPVGKAEVFDLRDRIRQEGDLTLLMIEHETEELLNADRVLLVRDGQVAALGPAGDILRRVEVLDDMGLMVPGIPAYFHRMEADELPLTPEEGVQAFGALGWRIAEEPYKRLLDEDRRRMQGCGDVVIRCEGLRHQYEGGVFALDGIDLELRRGEMVALVGRNGGGKTTLVKHFNGLLMPTDGEVAVNGQATARQGVFELGKTVGYVFQNPDHQIFSETVFDEVAFSLRLRGEHEEEIRQRVAASLDAVGLSGMEKEDPFGLDRSGRKRVAVASVLAAGPEVLVLDEPTTGLDYAGQRNMMEMVRRLNREGGSTVVFITHHMWVVAEYAHRVVVVSDGHVLMDDSPRAVFSRPDVMREARLKPPHIVELSSRLGTTLLTVDEMVACTRTGRDEP